MAVPLGTSRVLPRFSPQHNSEDFVCTEVPLTLFDSLASHPEPSGPGAQLRQETFVFGKQRGTKSKPDPVPDQLGPDLCFAL